MIFFDLKIFQYGESLTTEKISLGHKFRPLFLYSEMNYHRHTKWCNSRDGYMYRHDRRAGETVYLLYSTFYKINYFPATNHISIIIILSKLILSHLLLILLFIFICKFCSLFFCLFFFLFFLCFFLYFLFTIFR